MIASWIHQTRVRASFARFGGHDLAAFMNAWADDGVFIYPGSTSLAGRFEGKKAVEAWFRRYMDAFPRIEFTVKSIGIERPFGLLSNVANVEWQVSVTNRHREDFTYDGMTTIRAVNGRVVLVRDYFDTSILARALGEEARGAPRAG